MPHSLANKILHYEKIQRASAVEVFNYYTNTTTAYFARVIFVNTFTVGIQAILLNSLSSRSPNRFGNGSDQLERNLMDHH